METKQKEKSVLDKAVDAYRRVKNKELQLARARLEAQAYVSENLSLADLDAFTKQTKDIDKRMEDKIGFVAYKEVQARQAFEKRIRAQLAERLSEPREEDESETPVDKGIKDESRVIVQRV